MALSGIYDAFKHWDNQTTWIYSDPHFSDKDLEKSIINRPSDEQQIANINACAGRKDTLICLGDVGNIECVRRLRAARKILIMGNHDSGATNYKREIVSEVYETDKYTQEEVRQLCHIKYPGWNVKIILGLAGWVVQADNYLFDEVYEGALIIGEKLILSHEPVDIPWLFNIHGHDHSGKSKKGHLNVCSDMIGYKPVNLNQFLKSGALANIQTIHRETIDNATKRKAKRGGKKIGSR